VETLNKHPYAVLTSPEVRADIEQRGATVLPDRTRRQKRDLFLKEIEICTANFESVGLTQQEPLNAPPRARNESE
jgi:hypothetical protein